ncbi:hypothetical protein SynA1528_02380 [Synechococcus sp. A15-28]|nr:hypothetical protein SynA1528_02380 [Synechococcus sp. A15-28]
MPTPTLQIRTVITVVLVTHSLFWERGFVFVVGLVLSIGMKSQRC